MGFQSAARGFTALALLCLGMAWAGTARAEDALNFKDALTGPQSPYLEIPFDKFGYTEKGLLRTSSKCGNSAMHCGDDRVVVKGLSGGLLGTNFVAEVTVRSDAATDIAWFGFGTGAQNTGYYNEPQGFIFRIHKDSYEGGYFGIDAAVDDPRYGAFSFIAPITYDGKNRVRFNPAGTRFRLERKDDAVTFSLLDQRAVPVTISLSKYAPSLKLDETNTRVIFANGATGTSFSDLTLGSERLGGKVTYSWAAGDWSACSASCGGGLQKREVVCTGSDGSTDPGGKYCSGQEKPASEQKCNEQPCDTDGDGVTDDKDLCPKTPYGAKIDGTGCSGAQNVARLCAGPWKNHGQYVSCVAHVSKAQVALGLLTDQERADIVSAAGRSSIGK